jgi:hypothetical protein
MDPTDSVIPAAFQELARLAWNRDPSLPIPGAEARSIYEANRRHVAADLMTDRERALVDALAARFGGGHLLATK